MGLVTWNSNARILDIGASYQRNQATSKTVTQYTDPTTSNTKRTSIWYAKNSPVPLFTRPANGWKGCVHARFLGTSTESNNADLYVSMGKFGTKDWVAWKPAFNNADGDEMQCPSQGIRRLTNKKSDLTTAISAVTNPSGNTDLAVGLHWGWALLGISGSPFTGDGTEPPKQGEGTLVRAIVLMTDGANTQHDADAYEGALSASKLDDRTKTIAQRIKDEGVIIYGIQFGYKSGPQETLMKQVASGPGAPYYQYAPDAASLKTAFQEIGNHLSKLRLSKERRPHPTSPAPPPHHAGAAHTFLRRRATPHRPDAGHNARPEVAIYQPHGPSLAGAETAGAPAELRVQVSTFTLRPARHTSSRAATFARSRRSSSCLASSIPRQISRRDIIGRGHHETKHRLQQQRAHGEIRPGTPPLADR
jgi:hypothetical protein